MREKTYGTDEKSYGTDEKSHRIWSAACTAVSGGSGCLTFWMLSGPFDKGPLTYIVAGAAAVVSFAFSILSISPFVNEATDPLKTLGDLKRE